MQSCALPPRHPAAAGLAVVGPTFRIGVDGRYPFRGPAESDPAAAHPSIRRHAMPFSLFRRSTSGPSASTEARSRAAARATLAQASDFTQARAPARPQDHKLSEPARRWLATLPPAILPRALCSQYPRIANRLALVWSDAVLTAHVLDNLLVDRRGGRRGFPQAVRDELLALAQHHRHHVPTSKLDGLEVVESFDRGAWDTAAMALGDR